MKTQDLQITNANGLVLSAKLELPANQKPTRFAIFAHCFACNSNFGAVRNISQGLTNHGFGVIRFDFAGLGFSKGDFSETNFSGNVSDLIDVFRFATENFQKPELLVGHSLGGAAALIAASKLPEVKAVATIGSPADVHHVTRLFKSGIDQIETQGEAEILIGTRPFTIKKQFIDDLANTDLTQTVKNLKKALLVMHSPQDEIVGINNAAALYHEAKHPKSFVSLDGADHLLSNKEDSLYVADVIGSWASRYIPKQESAEKISTKGEQVVAHLNLANNFTNQIQTDRHSILADEPASVGGDDLGFSPYELLNASLGACTTLTLKLYAERKQWDLREVNVYMSYDRKHTDDINFETGKMGLVDFIDKKVELIGNLDDEQRAKLIEIAARCPVHRTLGNGVIIKTQEAKSV